RHSCAGRQHSTGPLPARPPGPGNNARPPEVAPRLEPRAPSAESLVSKATKRRNCGASLLRLRFPPSESTMITWAMKKIFGTSHDRAIRRMKPKVNAINELEKDLKKLTDEDLKKKTAEFKEKIDNGATLDDLLIPAFAVCREASRRVLEMRHYDVQLIGGM